MKDKTPVEVLLEGLDKGSITEEAKSKLVTVINETVDVRVSAKEKLLTEEFETKKKVLLEEIEAQKAKLLKEAEENEKVLVEQAEKYKKELEEAVVEETQKYKVFVEKQRDDDISKHLKEAEEIVLEQTKEFKNKQDAALVEEVKKFKTELIDKVSDYLEAHLQESIPVEIYESAAKVAVLEPLVQSINEAYSRNFIKLDTTSFKLISEAKEKIGKLETLLQEKEKLEVTLKKEKREVERNVKIKSLTEGLTQQQKSKALKLLEGVEVENLENHYGKMRDIIIESVEPVKPVQKTQSLNESVKKPEVQPAAPKPTPVADKAVVDIQNKKVLEVLNESEDKNKPIAPKRDGTSQQIQTWSTKVTPRYREDLPKK